MTNEEAIMILKAMIDEMILVFDGDRKKALNMAIEALKAQPEPHWIPCDKDRPKNNQEVLICDIKGNVVQAVYLADVCMWYILRWNRGIKFEMTKAWMPLPEPAKLEND